MLTNESFGCYAAPGIDSACDGGSCTPFTPTPTTTPTETATTAPTATSTPTATNTPPAPCPATPPPGCKTGLTGKGSFSLSKKAGDPAKSMLGWKWSKGDATTMADLGVPTTTTAYRLCVYDGSNTKIMDLLAPAGGTCDNGKPCWKTAGTKGFNYKRKDGQLNGITGIILRSNTTPGKAKVSVKGKGSYLSVPTLLPLTQAPNPVQVLLINSSTSACWIASYSSPPTSKAGDMLKWKDKND